jgi:hypothetical protein
LNIEQYAKPIMERLQASASVKTIYGDPVITSLLIMDAFSQNLSLVAACTNVTLYTVADKYVDSK